MNLGESRLFQRSVASTLLLLLIWILALAALRYVGSRWEVGVETDKYRRNYQDFHDRRVELGPLRLQLQSLRSSAALRQSTLRAANQKTAVLNLQQVARAAIESGQGKLLSYVESNTDRRDRTVAIMIRARVPEGGLPRMLIKLEAETPRISIEEMQLSARTSKMNEVADLEINATLRAGWATSDASEQ